MEMNVSNLEPNQNIIYVTEEDHRSEWTYEATKELLKIYDEKTDMLETGIITTQKKLWELTARALEKKGYYYTGPQCENKWKALKRSYRTKLERMQKFGSCKRPCPFEYEVAEILSKRPNDSITRSYSLKINELKKHDDLFKVNLNEPPGFAKDDEDSLLEQEDDVKDVALLDEHLSYAEEQSPENGEPAYTVIQEESPTLLVEELSDLKRMLNKHNKVNAAMLSQATDVQEKILGCLERSVEEQTKVVEVMTTRAEYESEIVQQMKVQNELLQKLLDRLS